MKLQKITIKNIKSITDQVADFKGCTAIVTGGNNKGKSTLLRSLPDRIRGQKADQIVKHGESKGVAERELTDGTLITWTIVDGKEKFKLTLSNGLEIKDGVVKFLQEKYFGVGFDIDKFLLSTPKIQKKMLQDLVGLDFDEIDAEYKKAFEERRELNALLKIEKARVKECAETIEYNDTEKLQSTIQKARTQNENIRQKKSDLKTHQENKERIENEIKRMQDKLSIEIGHINVITGDLETMKEIDTAKLDQDLIQAFENNKQVDIQNENMKQIETVKDIELQYENADETVREIDQRRIDMTKQGNLPEGFSFDEDGVLYNGLPMSKEQLSSSALYIASLKLASMNVGELKTMFFDASYLDKNSLQDVQEWAEKEGYQLLIERPDYNGGDIQYEIICE